jgi:monothiol glutaredoxin
LDKVAEKRLYGPGMGQKCPPNRAFGLGCETDSATYIGRQGPLRRRGRQDQAASKDAIMSIEQFIENEVKTNDVVLFMKGTPQFPQCGFSGQVVQILDHVGVGYKGLNVLESAELRDGIKTYSNWPTIPQLYVKGEFIGGCDIVREMFQAGELQSLLAEKGVIEAQASA